MTSPPACLPPAHASDLHVDEVHRRIDALIARCRPVLPAENIALDRALGRVLGQDVHSPVSVPPHDNAAMDGYAFASSALQQGADEPLHLRIVGKARAGAAWAGTVAPGEAVRIMTGAVMPDGADTVVPQELCEADDTTLRFAPHAVVAGANRRQAGEDLQAGGLALARGERLGAAALGLLASLGQTHVGVYRRLRVAVVSTGDELLQPGQPPRPGAIYDSNRATLSTLVRQLGAELVDLGPVPDDPGVLAALFTSAAHQADLVLSSGGVSVGEADHTRAALAQAGELGFWHVAMRPGRPLAAGLLQGAGGHAALFLGLPGNPVAAMVSFLIFGRQALLQMAGCGPAVARLPPLLRARTRQALRKRPGRTEYQRALLQPVPGDLPVVDVAANQSSAVLSAMVAANALVVLHHDQGSVQPGDEVDVLLLDALG
ncbi:gephyrin-like molybdotransferase Glp [uncultured Pseudacidovorax sp.]|uniref:molybdopterin molybdotransferase MoeA n=1 Tax=uncultured Pseudacidovorax sp. TaxID=679313 RepID=UPI0025DADBF5|nr:gephyrin-like molybdotransferase Glp [uncultured Pseudacidovorax sp.]